MRERTRAGTRFQQVQAPIRVMIVDDHAILRAGVREMLSEEADLQVVGEAGSAEEALQQLREGSRSTSWCWTSRCRARAASTC